MSRRAWVLLAIPVVLVLGLVLGPLAYAALQDDAPPAATVQAQPSGAELSSGTDGSWTVSDGSTAGYRVDEVLNGADVTVAGTTGQVSGSVVVEGGALESAEVVVDVASVPTDSARRDAYFRDSIMDVGTHPTATFTVTGPVQLPELSGTPVTVPVTGELTLAGETRAVQVDLSVVRTPEGVDVSGSIPVVFTDFAIEPPNLGFVRVDDQGTVSSCCT
ncbi:YceI family protein [Blastococcus tunisiensis]|uniref:YceI-like domain-containing protein n=1 Tax=Blastococcus tunisiensis TaxID=1798228 RepID=A0A1I1XKU3_9ACTN|nr:YceI family protein [Blastococcus sp. DSM 46838]SFE06010.1 YceI-like domain-containing protein [Blastococcus sp. DSM 46838]